MFDVRIYKENHSLVIQPDVHVGDQVDFLMQPKLYFGIVRNMHVGDTFTSLEIVSALSMFDLTKYPNGIVVTLNEQLGSGQFSFSASHMEH